MKKHEESFESYLREFAPRRPRGLELTQKVPRLWVGRLAAAAVVVVAVGSVWWAARKNGNAEESVNGVIEMPDAAAAPRLLLLSLTRTALRDPEQFDTELDAASRVLLPNFRKSSSTLRVLTKERLSGE